MIFFEDSDRIWENENPLLRKGGIRVQTPPLPPPAPRTRQGVFKVGCKKENKSDLFLIKSKRDHFFLILKLC
jgi:hypothetical protein